MQVTPKPRPHRLAGVTYDQPGPAFHCRLATWDRIPAFARPDAAQLAVDALRFYHGKSVEVLAYCVMPDHVHLLVRIAEGGPSLSRWIGDFKRWVSRAVRKQLELELTWQPGFFERVIRDTEDLVEAARYVVGNPVRAGLAGNPQDYFWSGSFVYDL